MNLKPLATFGKMAAMAFLLVIPGLAAADPDDGYEILTRGPVHEAFASTVNHDPEAGIVIDTAPPGTIEELPPEQQLEGENVVWIPGYWAWDEEQGSYLWISGIWRNLPPGRQWNPGYWNPVAEQRFQWVSGYWSDTEASQVSYLPAPPRSIESGPSIAAGNADEMWLPGSWVYQQDKYAWRAGHWDKPRENWIYVPAHYVWTPRGHVFVDGYWDHAVPRRGVVFAPVRYQRPIYANAGYRYSPRLAVNLSVFMDHLFLRPSYSHYYFGDYYAPVYKTKGFRPWHEHHKKHRCYDPVYAYTRWCHRDEPEWEHNHKKRYDKLCEQESDRPPHTWAAMQSRPEYREPSKAFATPIEEYAGKHATSNGQKFRKMERPEREQMAEKTREVRNFGKERQKAEGRADSSSPAKVVKTERSKSPIASRERSDSPETSRGKKETGKPDKSDSPKGGPEKTKPEIAEREKGRPDSGPATEQSEKSSKKATPQERKSDQGKSDQGKSDQGKSDQGKSEQRKSEQRKPDQPKSEQRKPDQPKSEQRKPDQPKSEQRKPDQSKPDQRKSEQPKSEQRKSDTPKATEKPRRNEETRPAEKTKQEKAPQRSESKPQRDAKPERGKGGGDEVEKGGKKREK